MLEALCTEIKRRRLEYDRNDLQRIVAHGLEDLKRWAADELMARDPLLNDWLCILKHVPDLREQAARAILNDASAKGWMLLSVAKRVPAMAPEVQRKILVQTGGDVGAALSYLGSFREGHEAAIDHILRTFRFHDLLCLIHRARPKFQKMILARMGPLDDREKVSTKALFVALERAPALCEELCRALLKRPLDRSDLLALVHAASEKKLHAVAEEAAKKLLDAEDGVKESDLWCIFERVPSLREGVVERLRLLELSPQDLRWLSIYVSGAAPQGSATELRACSLDELLDMVKN